MKQQIVPKKLQKTFKRQNTPTNAYDHKRTALGNQPHTLQYDKKIVN